MTKGLRGQLLGWVGCALLVVALVVSWAIGIQAVASGGAPDMSQLECQEDEPCWDCETMGNGICGKEAS